TILVQVKHRTTGRSIGTPTIDAMHGLLKRLPIIGAGLIVTNTTFSAPARRIAEGRLALRDRVDVGRWIANTFLDGEEFRDLPGSLEIAPGIVVRLRGN